ncbi:unnamed protein product [Rangifer tarandus platyrhynchus]|uniref:Uncharacterized protein n=2 Tax=Rangifer tarandus platyrhynchus TaxID=3082113 RepID=A0ABN8ZFG8_RANTA|nr:unnamed protein product [Rangifer tarandus platyrhynchus]
MGSQRVGNHGIWIANPSQCSEKLDRVQSQKADSQGPEATEIKAFDEICCPLSRFFKHMLESQQVSTLALNYVQVQFELQRAEVSISSPSPTWPGTPPPSCPLRPY